MITPEQKEEIVQIFQTYSGIAENEQVLLQSILSRIHAFTEDFGAKRYEEGIEEGKRLKTEEFNSTRKDG